MRKWLLGLAIAGVAVAALAQVPTSWTGNELINITLASGSGSQISLAQTRNATAATVTATVTGTLATTNVQNRVIFGTALTGTVTLNTPTNPYDGEMMEVVNGTNAAFTQTITFAPSAGQSLIPTASGALATLAAGASGEFQYVAATATWYRIR